MTVLGVVGVLMMLLEPQVHPLLVMFFYSIPSNCAISLFPHEPAMLLLGRTVNAWHLTVSATLGTLAAAFLDYKFFSTVLNVEVTASRYRDRPFYRKARRWFYKAPFLSLVVAGATPVPFFPFKFLVYASKYPHWKFLLAVVLGRFPRYLVLALAGYAFRIPTWIILIGFCLIVVSLYSRSAWNWAVARVRPGRVRRSGGGAREPAGEEERIG